MGSKIKHGVDQQRKGASSRWYQVNIEKLGAYIKSNIVTSEQKKQIHTNCESKRKSSEC